MNKVTVVLLSYNRFHLLTQTIDSFFAINKYPIEKFIISEDSCNREMQLKLLNYANNRFQLIFNGTNVGPYKSTDNMNRLVDTEYIFHCEDDWKFISNPNFIKQSMDILEERKDIHQVWIRKDIDQSWIENEIHKTNTSVKYKMVKNPHLGGWCGFSGNAGLRRKSDYLKMFPNGYAEFIQPNVFSGLTELACNNNAAKQGYRAASLIDPACIHIGQHQTTIF